MTPKDTERLTAEQRADKIYRYFHSGMEPGLFQQCEVDFIATQIEEAERDGYERARIDLNAIHAAKWKKEDYAEGFTAAREMAAGVAKNCWNHHDLGVKCHGQGIANDIRALETTK